MDESQEFCLRWDIYQQQLSQSLLGLQQQELLVDVTLSCSGKTIKAHRAVLSACSSYFQELFTEAAHVHPHPIVILNGVEYEDIKLLVHFMYHGEVTAAPECLPRLLKTAEALCIKGLADTTADAVNRNRDKINTVHPVEQAQDTLPIVVPLPSATTVVKSEPVELKRNTGHPTKKRRWSSLTEDGYLEEPAKLVGDSRCITSMSESSQDEEKLQQMCTSHDIKFDEESQFIQHQDSPGTSRDIPEVLEDEENVQALRNSPDIIIDSYGPTEMQFLQQQDPLGTTKNISRSVQEQILMAAHRGLTFNKEQGGQLQHSPGTSQDNQSRISKNVFFRKDDKMTAEEVSNCLCRAEKGEFDDKVVTDTLECPKAGEVFLFRGTGRNVIPFDWYNGFRNIGCNMNRSSKGVKTMYYRMTDFPNKRCYVNFRKHVYSLSYPLTPNKPAYIVHYLGDESQYKPRQHGNSLASKIIHKYFQSSHKTIGATSKLPFHS